MTHGDPETCRACDHVWDYSKRRSCPMCGQWKMTAFYRGRVLKRCPECGTCRDYLTDRRQRCPSCFDAPRHNVVIMERLELVNGHWVGVPSLDSQIREALDPGATEPPAQ